MMTNNIEPTKPTKRLSAKTILVSYLLASLAVVMLTHVVRAMWSIELDLLWLLTLLFLGPIAFLGIAPLPNSTALIPQLVFYSGGTALFFVPFFISRRLGLTPSFGGNVFFGILWFGIGALGLLAAASR